jgi:hypothetical protein
MVSLTVWIIALWAVAWLAPNSQQFSPPIDPHWRMWPYAGMLRWKPTRYWLISIAAGLLWAVTEIGGKVSEFLYFQF